MFSIGEYLIYGVTGVCSVTEICHSPYDKTDPRQYYALRPFLENSGSVIYSPVDNEAVLIRRLSAKEDLERILHKIPAIEEIAVSTEKARRDTYRQIYGQQTPENHLRILKTVAARRKALSAARKHLPEVDLDYEARAKRCLYAEISLVFDLAYEEVRSLISSLADGLIDA